MSVSVALRVSRRKCRCAYWPISSVSRIDNKLNFTDAGNARSFVCNYHGWAFGIDGALRGMAGQELFDESGMNRAEHGLHPVAQVATYKGLVFGNMDPDAPSLNEYLGDFRYYLDVILDMDEEGTEFVGG